MGISRRVKALLPVDAYEVVATRSYRDEKPGNAVIWPSAFQRGPSRGRNMRRPARPSTP